MDYEIVELKEKKVIGLTARTRNSDENMAQVIGGLWQRFFGEEIYQAIENKQNDKSIGLYSNYETDASGAYDVTVCCEVNKTENLFIGTKSKIISAGKYAKFIIHGHMQKAVADFWAKLWEMPLDRKYSCDFEEYQSGTDMENAEIHVYISLK